MDSSEHPLIKMPKKDHPYRETGNKSQETVSNKCFGNCTIKRVAKVSLIIIVISLVSYWFKFKDVRILDTSNISNPESRYTTILSLDYISDEDYTNGNNSSINDTNLVRSIDPKNLISLFENRNVSESDPCSPILPGLIGPIEVNVSNVKIEDLVNNPEMKLLDYGGHYSPRHCKANHRVAIIIPYRNREEHLAIFLNNMHKFLMKQDIEYQIYIVEQLGNNKFNRAKLLNIGFVEALTEKPYWECFIFHDVDKLPMDDRNLYTCSIFPRHYSAAIDIDNFKLPYPDFFGGVTGVNTKQFITVNGFSNRFWGWGGEDDDFYNRMKFHKLSILRYPPEISKYKSFDHERPAPNPRRFDLLINGKRLFNEEGLTNLRYILHETILHQMYTKFSVKIKI